MNSYTIYRHEHDGSMEYETTVHALTAGHALARWWKQTFEWTQPRMIGTGEYVAIDAIDCIYMAERQGR